VKKPLGRSRHRRENNIKINLREIVYRNVDWIRRAHDRVHWRDLINTLMTSGSMPGGKFLY